MTVPQKWRGGPDAIASLDIRRAIARELIPDGVTLRYTKPNGTTIRAFSIRWLDGFWHDGRRKRNAAPVLAQSVKFSTPAQRVISIPVAVVELATLLGCTAYIWRYQAPSDPAVRFAKAIRLDELAGRALTERGGELFIRLGDMKQLNVWPGWAFVTTEVDVHDLTAAVRAALERAERERRAAGRCKS